MLNLPGYCLVFRMDFGGNSTLALNLCRQVSFVQDQGAVQYLLALGELELLGSKGETKG